MYKEFNDLLLKARSGHIDSKEEILERLHPLIVKSIQRYYNNRAEYDDLIQDGNVTILQCIENFAESKDVYFLGYVKTMLKYTYLNKHKLRHHLSLNEVVGDDEDNEWIDLIESQEEGPLDQVLRMEDVSSIDKALAILGKRQMEVVVAYYMEDLSIGDIAKKFAITYRTVLNTKSTALAKMRKFMS